MACNRFILMQIAGYSFRTTIQVILCKCTDLTLLYKNQIIFALDFLIILDSNVPNIVLS